MADTLSIVTLVAQGLKTLQDAIEQVSVSQASEISHELDQLMLPLFACSSVQIRRISTSFPET